MKHLPFMTRMALLCGLGLGALPLAALATAASFPTHPVTLVIPFPPGGATDVNGRVIAQRLGKELGQPVVIENRAGAGTVVGASYVAKAAPDGYTLLLSSGSTFTVNPAIRPNLPYDPVKSFEPIGIAGRVALILLANSEVPVQHGQAVRGLREGHAGQVFVWLLRHRHHLAVRRRNHAARDGLKMTHVPYKGSAPCDDRPDGRPDPVQHRHGECRDPAAQERQDQGHCADHCKALVAAARCAHVRRERLRRRRHGFMAARQPRKACPPM
jgi:tripartite-type tricarboxylate transporter receptor subunit TctC